MNIGFNVIHVPSCTERSEAAASSTAILTQAGFINLNCPAVYTPTWTEVDRFSERNPQCSVFPHTNFGTTFPEHAGVFGTFASHFKVWESIIDQGLTSAIVLEDDIRLLPRFIHTLNHALMSIPQGFDFLFLYAPPVDTPLFKSEVHGINNPLVCYSYQTWSTAAYLVSQQGALKALTDVATFGFSMPIDWYIFCRGPGLFENYSLRPEIPLIAEPTHQFYDSLASKAQQR